MNHYRISFVVRFEHIVTADNAEAARKIAEELRTMPSVAVASADKVEGQWSVIERVNGNDDRLELGPVEEEGYPGSLALPRKGGRRHGRS